MYGVFKFNSYETFREFVIETCGDDIKKWDIVSVESFKGQLIVVVYKEDHKYF